MRAVAPALSAADAASLFPAAVLLRAAPAAGPAGARKGGSKVCVEWRSPPCSLDDLKGGSRAMRWHARPAASQALNGRRKIYDPLR